MRLLIIFLTIFGFINAEVLLKENFNSLKEWKPLNFEKIKKHSVYKTKNSVLIVKSDASASGIIFKKSYNIYKYPVLTFRWKVGNIYKKGDAKTKKGDDYPIRIYVMFEYNPNKASFFKSVKYALAKSIYGSYPPDSTINYIWANKNYKDEIITSAYTDRAKMIVLDHGNKFVGKWRTHTVNVLADYKKAFGERPPKTVSLAIMSDSDNTEESSTAYIDFIEVKSE